MKILFRLIAIAVVSVTVHAETAQAADFRAGSTALVFDDATGGLIGVQRQEPAHEFVRQASDNPLLWRLTLRAGVDNETALDNTQAGRPTFSVAEGSLVMEWPAVALPGEPDALGVRVECEPMPGSDTVLMRLRVRNDSKRFGLLTVQFPVIAPLSEPKAADVAMGRGTWGRLSRGAEEKMRGEYPSHLLPMQFALVNEGESGLYLAAHDPGARYKTFEITPGGEFCVSTRVADMGVPGSDWDAPYAFALGTYNGDWMVGAKQYRAWVTQQTPWTRKGRLAQRKDVPEGIKSVCAWLQGGGTAEEFVPKVKQFAEGVGAPVGVHWYNWHTIPFDVNYPNYFPPKPGFAEGVAELTKAGVVVMPYINARLWDSTNEDFAEARPFATLKANGEVNIEVYDSGAKLAVMCPTQEFWQKKVREIIRRLGEECGVNAVYMDQIAAAPPRMCFDAAHGHAIGSGDWWAESYRQILAPVKEWCTSEGRQIALTTENCAEPYMDNVDAHLAWTERDAEDIPLTTAVYSGYTLYFASNRAFFDDTSYSLCQARDFVWGTQLGWDGAQILAPEHKGKLEFLSRLAQMRNRAKDYLVYGELLQVLPAGDGVPELTGTWNTHQGDAPVTLKAAHGALWRLDERRFAVLLANADKESHAFPVKLDLEAIAAPGIRDWVVKSVQLDGSIRETALSGAVYEGVEEVPARGALMLEFQPRAAG